MSYGVWYGLCKYQDTAVDLQLNKHEADIGAGRTKMVGLESVAINININIRTT
jgi:hypothetical protein